MASQGSGSVEVGACLADLGPRGVRLHRQTRVGDRRLPGSGFGALFTRIARTEKLLLPREESSSSHAGRPRRPFQMVVPRLSSH